MSCKTFEAASDQQERAT